MHALGGGKGGFECQLIVVHRALVVIHGGLQPVSTGKHRAPMYYDAKNTTNKPMRQYIFQNRNIMLCALFNCPETSFDVSSEVN
jgi:hypothetical protein